MTPETHFAENEGVSIAYQVFGDGPRDLIIIPGWLSNLDIFWEEPRVARFFQALAGFSRVILIDRRGTGLSDRSNDFWVEGLWFCIGRYDIDCSTVLCTGSRRVQSVQNFAHYC